MTTLGTLYLIPVMLGDDTPATDVLPASVMRAVSLIDNYVVENSKVARKFIKAIDPTKVQATLNLFELNKHTDAKELKTFIQPLLEGKNMGLMSDAGCPGVAELCSPPGRSGRALWWRGICRDPAGHRSGRRRAGRRGNPPVA